MSGWPSTDDMASALPEPTTDAWGATDSSATPGVDAWGASGDVGDAGEAGGEDEAARPSYTPAGITKTPGEHGWADKKNAAYDYASLSKTSKEVAEEQAARQEASGQAGEDFGAVGGLVEGQWASNATVYEWKEDYGDVGPEFPDLERQLFGSELHVTQGIEFDQIASLDVVQEGTVRIIPVRKFEDAGLHPTMLRNTQLAGYKVPTPIQQYCFSAIFKGYDIVACAQTGSGKTAAFLIPILSKLMGKAKKLAAPRPNPALFVQGVTPPVKAEPLVLIICPTRELATQIFDEARRFCYRTMLRPCVIYGGGPISEQVIQLQKGCDVLIGTPGRLCDFINRPHLLTLKRLKYMVIDEADEMLQSDWETELKQIMQGGDQDEGNITYMMFSATFPKIARDLATQHLAHDHVRIRVGRAGSSHQNIKQEIIYVEPSMKKQAVFDLLMSAPPARTIIFVNSKRAADEVDDYLFNREIPCTGIHGDRTQREREDSIRAFRSGKAPVLIATGVSARGLDIHHVAHVINYDLPSNQHGGIDEYTHRIGRTGRIGNTGVASSFYNDRDVDISEMLVKVLLENRQPVPDFLVQYIPEGYEDGKGDVTKLQFEPDEEEQAEGGDAWGSSADANAASGWGQAAPAKAEAPDAWGSTTEAAPSAPAKTEDAWGSGGPRW